MNGISIKAHNITIRRNSLSESTKVMDDTEDEYTSLLHDNEGILLLYIFIFLTLLYYNLKYFHIYLFINIYFHIYLYNIYLNIAFLYFSFFYFILN